MFQVTFLIFYIFYCGIEGTHSMKNDKNIPPELCINNEKMDPVGLYTFFPGEVVNIRSCLQNFWYDLKYEYILLVKPELATDEHFWMVDGVTEKARGVKGMLVKMTPQHNGSYIHGKGSAGNVTLVLGDNTVGYYFIVNGIALKPSYNVYFLQERNEHLFLKLNKKFNGTVDIPGMHRDKSWDGQRALELIPYDDRYRFSITIEEDKNKKIRRERFLLEVSPDYLFDPVITGLEASKIVARYKSPVTNVIKYELDVEANDISISCSSSYGQVIVNGKTAKYHNWLLFTKTASGTYHRVLNCSVIHNDLIITTLLHITKAKKSNKSLPQIESLLPGTSQNTSMTTRIDDNRTEELPSYEEMSETTTKEYIKPKNRANTSQADLSKEHGYTLGEAPSHYQTLIASNLSTMFATAVLMAIIFTVYLKCRRGDQGADESSDPLAPMYEPIYYSTCKSGTEGETVDISKRSQEPLPADNGEENGKYIHYDTPYDHRFDRRMNARIGK